MPYNAVKVKETPVIFFVEGEKCAATLKKYLTPEVLAGMSPPLFPDEVTVTCIIGGTGGWKPELAAWFLGKTVIIYPDHDKPGYDFAWKVKREIEQAAAESGQFTSVDVLQWPEGTPENWDIADELTKGGTL